MKGQLLFYIDGFMIDSLDFLWQRQNRMSKPAYVLLKESAMLILRKLVKPIWETGLELHSQGQRITFVTILERKGIVSKARRHCVPITIPVLDPHNCS